MLTFLERQEIVRQFPGAIARMRECLHKAGREASEDEITLAWATYSDNLCAGWLTPQEDDAELLKILLRHLPARGRLEAGVFCTTLKETGDGTGDAILELPPALMQQLGWQVGDTLSVSRNEEPQLLLRRVVTR